jgi:putative ABC transport system substrate-binding protein
MKRRDLHRLAAITMFGWPLAARGQQRGLPLIGYLASDISDDSYTRARVAGFRAGLKEAGYAEGRNVEIEFAWANGQYNRLPEMAQRFVHRPVALILAAALPAAIAATAATSTIPIVFVSGADPVAVKVVQSLSRPGGNATGVSQFYGPLIGKRLELLRELVPDVAAIAVLFNPKNPNATTNVGELEMAAQAIGQKLEQFSAATDVEIDAAYAAFGQRGIKALVVVDDPYFHQTRARLIALDARYGLATTYWSREFVSDGGLVSYGSDTANNYRLAGGYAGRILKGARPAELPILQPTKFELVINLKTARVMGLRVPASLLARADEVIE